MAYSPTPVKKLPIGIKAEIREGRSCPCGSVETVWVEELEEYRCRPHIPLKHNGRTIYRRQSCGCVYRLYDFGTARYCEFHTTLFPLATAMIFPPSKKERAVKGKKKQGGTGLGASFIRSPYNQ